MYFPYKAFLLTWLASIQIYWGKKKCLHKERVQLSQDWFGTPIWPPFHCFGNNETAANSFLMQTLSFFSKNLHRFWPLEWKRFITRIHPRAQYLGKFMGKKEIFYLWKEFNSLRICLEHQYGRRFIVLEHQYGRRDVMWIGSIGIELST